MNVSASSIKRVGFQLLIALNKTDAETLEAGSPRFENDWMTSSVVVLPHRFSGELKHNLGNIRNESIAKLAIIHKVIAISAPFGNIKYLLRSALMLCAS